MAVDGPKIPALWFCNLGFGPSELAMRVQARPAPEETLGLRIVPMNSDSLVYGIARDMLGSGFLLQREHAVTLHAQIGSWLAANPCVAEVSVIPPDATACCGTSTIAGGPNDRMNLCVCCGNAVSRR
jgi:hypothetical protein